jgi:hypothetical protein
LIKFTLHPLIHTLLDFNLAQDFGGCQAGGSVGEEGVGGLIIVGEIDDNAYKFQALLSNPLFEVSSHQ